MASPKINQMKDDETISTLKRIYYFLGIIYLTKEEATKLIKKVEERIRL